MRKKLYSPTALGGYGVLILTIMIFFAQGGFSDTIRNKSIYIIGIIIGAGLFLYSLLRTDTQTERENANVNQELDKQSTPVQNNVKSATTTSNTEPIMKKTAHEDKPSLTPLKIYETLNKLPPFQIEQAAKNYQGIEVEWLVEFGTTRRISEKVTRIHAVAPKPLTSFDVIIIVFSIDIEKYPQLKIMNRGETFTVIGTIVSVETSTIYLDNCVLHTQ